MTPIELILMFFIHWLADFPLQTSRMALNKGKNIYWLWTHVAVYASVWWIGVFIFPFITVLKFVVITFICHFITDFITSKLTGLQYERKIYNGWTGFFTIIGFDQFLHAIQLVLTYYYLTK